MVLDYGVRHEDSTTLEQEIHQLLIMNLKSVDEEEIVVVNDYITVSVTKTVDRIFPFLFPNQNNRVQIKKTVSRKNIKE